MAFEGSQVSQNLTDQYASLAMTVVVMSGLRPPFTEGHEQMDRPEKSVCENRKMVWHRFLGEELSQAQ